MNRDVDNRCEMCYGQMRRIYKCLETHHILTRGAYPNLKKEKLNLINLCNFCHEWVHANPEIGYKKIKQIMSRKYYNWEERLLKEAGKIHTLNYKKKVVKRRKK